MAASAKPVVVITDVATSAGGLIARHFIGKGWSAVGMVRPGQNPKLRSKALDVQPAELTRSGDLERVIHGALRRYGHIDAVIFNGGYGLVGPIDSLTYSQMREQLSVNVLAAAELIRVVTPVLVRQGSGALVAVANLFNTVGLPGYAVYSASQHAMKGLFEALYFELKPKHVRVKLVDPGGISQIGRLRLVNGSGRKWQEDELGPRFGLTHNRVGTSERDAKEAARIYQAAVDQHTRFHYGKGPRWLKLCQKVLPVELYHRIVERTMI